MFKDKTGRVDPRFLVVVFFELQIWTNETKNGSGYDGSTFAYSDAS